MNIEFVNHASFIINHKNISVICDPWIDGTVFDNSWSLLSKTNFKYEDFNRITHIWFSHEHPDHFNPPNIKKIPEEIRKNITILFQTTLDKKVVKYCQNMGFKEVVELPKGEYYKISDDFECLNMPFTFDDSYICFKVGGKTILNLNDCIVNKHSLADEIANVIKVPHLDVLFTQFSYASKYGNTDDVELRQKIAKEKLERIKIQNELFKPKSIVPFASYCWFCHDENFYMNEGINTVHDVVKYAENNNFPPIITLYPGDVWDFSLEYDSTSALEKYRIDYDSLATKERLKTEPIKDIKELELLGENYINNILEKNPLMTKKTFRDAKVFLKDFNLSYTLSLKSGLQKSSTQFVEQDCDISISSKALWYILKFPWGGDTVNVNARFQEPQNGEYWKFRQYTNVTSLNNFGKEFKPMTLADKLKNKIKGILG